MLDRTQLRRTWHAVNGNNKETGTSEASEEDTTGDVCSGEREDMLEGIHKIGTYDKDWAGW